MGPEAAKILPVIPLVPVATLPLRVIPPPAPVASKLTFRFNPSADTLTPEASPVTEIASALVFAERKVKVPQLATPCALTSPEPVATPLIAILPVPELIVTPRREIPNDMAVLAVLAFLPRKEMFPPLELKFAPDRR